MANNEASAIHDTPEQEKHYTIIQYNVENFFYPQCDSLNPDSDFTESGKYRWGFTKYYSKRDNICKVLANIAQWDTPIIVSLCEIENAQCLADLCKKLQLFHYRFVHVDSRDKRGIDVALLYDCTHFSPLTFSSISGKINDAYYTRDILMLKGVTYLNDTLHVFACHMPSKLGGAKLSDERRNIVRQKIQFHVDSILALNKDAYIVILGDMNDSPKDNIRDMHNIVLNCRQNNMGTYKYRGKWEVLDQIYVSSALKNMSTYRIYSPEWLLEEDIKYLGYKPKRTYIGYKYNTDGYSDHLPIILYINKH